MNVKVRKFPYPFKCAFSISSDIDNASSLECFVHFMDFLNSTNQTIYGPGLGLEVGNSFWFFNGSKSFQLSYFEGLTKRYWRPSLEHIYNLNILIPYIHGETLIKVVLKEVTQIKVWKF